MLPSLHTVVARPHASVAVLDGLTVGTFKRSRGREFHTIGDNCRAVHIRHDGCDPDRIAHGGDRRSAGRSDVGWRGVCRSRLPPAGNYSGEQHGKERNLHCSLVDGPTCSLARRSRDECFVNPSRHLPHCSSPHARLRAATPAPHARCSSTSPRWSRRRA